MKFNVVCRLSVIVGIMVVIGGCASDDDVSRTSKVVLAIGDKITVLSEEQYQLPIVVQVAELNGAAIADATVSLSIKPTGFYKGAYQATDTSVPADGTADELVRNITVTCLPEDVNNNGILDPGEDVNNNGLLEPDIPSITAHPTETPTLTPGTQKLETDDNGFGYFSITYPKAQATWVDVELTASVSGGLPENRAVQSFLLLVLKADLEEVDVFHAFVDSPYGASADCTSAS
ncbi:MAG: hypothetical protein HKN34_11185 [Gammaproteobacteria bacterium]|nr:hypothetical protein [Gammaproteobacteria bacterium]